MAKSEKEKNIEVISSGSEPSNFNMESEKVGKAKSNNTMVYLLAAVCIALIIFIAVDKLGGTILGGTIGVGNMKDKIEGFINTELIPEGGVTVDSLKQESGVYVAEVTYQGQSIPLYFTTDGKFISPGRPLYSLTSANSTDSSSDTASPQNVPKTAKPKVQGFFFAYCPYGTQFEKAMVPVYNLLKNKADISVVFIGAMHGEYEKVESLRQICIQKNYGNDKLWKYLKAFDETSAISSCSGTASCVDPLIQKIYTILAIDKAKIDACMTKDAPALYDAQVEQATDAGISGSPTFVINGVQVSVNRSPEAIKKAVCDAFTTAPKECETVLSTTAASPGFGASAGSSTGAQC
jgi:protein-disulfide isomerase